MKERIELSKGFEWWGVNWEILAEIYEPYQTTSQIQGLKLD